MHHQIQHILPFSSPLFTIALSSVSLHSQKLVTRWSQSNGIEVRTNRTISNAIYRSQSTDWNSIIERNRISVYLQIIFDWFNCHVSVRSCSMSIEYVRCLQSNQTNLKNAVIVSIVFNNRTSISRSLSIWFDWLDRQIRSIEIAFGDFDQPMVK